MQFFQPSRLLCVLILSAPSVALSENRANRANATLQSPVSALMPILPLTPDASKMVFFDRDLRDPAKEAFLLQRLSKSDNKTLEEEIADARADLRDAKSKKRPVLLYKIYIDSLALAYRGLESAALARKVSGAGYVGDEAKVRDFQRVMVQLEKAAKDWQNVVKKKEEKLEITYHQGLAFFSSGRLAEAAAILRPVVKVLPESMSLRSQLMVDFCDISLGEAAAKANAVKDLMTLADRLPPLSQTAVKLTTARLMAGFNAAGARAGSASDKYGAELTALSSMTEKLAPFDQKVAALAALGIWRAVTGEQASWIGGPVNAEKMGAKDLAWAVFERQTLEMAHVGKYSGAIAAYMKLAEADGLGAHRMEIDRRILMLGEAQYLVTKDSAAYDAVLTSVGGRYPEKNTDSKESGQTGALRGEIRERNHRLVANEIKLAELKDSTEAKRASSIALVRKYLASFAAGNETESFTAALAGLCARNGQVEEAVGIYLGLADKYPKSRDFGAYLDRALGFQLALAKWPAAAPWDKMPTKELTKEREQLLVILRRIDGFENKPVVWPRLGQIGLLLVSLGRPNDAFKLWREGMTKSPVGPDAARAGGHMLVILSTGKRWAELESLARLVINARMVPMHQGKMVVSFEMLRLALYFGGREAMENKQYASASAKFDEYVTVFRGAPNRDEVFALLARARFSETNYVKGVMAYAGIMVDYPKSTYLREALIKGGDMSVEIGWEEQASNFYLFFVDRFATDAEMPRIRDALVPLYVGQGRYADAASILRRLMRDKSLSTEIHIQAAVMSMTIEERYGDLAKAGALAREVLRLPGLDMTNKAFAYSVWARGLDLDKHERELKGIEEQLAKIGTESVVLQEALSEIRFLHAEAVSRALNDSLTRPDDLYTKGSLDRRKGAYATIAAAYKKVCAAGERGYCAPAMYRLGLVGDEAIRGVETIEIPPAATEAEEARLLAGKKSFTAQLAAERTAVRKRARELVMQGLCSPDWVTEVARSLRGDWQLEPFDDRAADGYVQWTVAQQQK